MEVDPLQKMEQLVRESHDSMHAQTHDVRRRYPLLFLLLVTVFVSAIFHGLDRIMDLSPFIDEHPVYLFIVGMVGLFLTGTLYKRLGKERE